MELEEAIEDLKKFCEYDDNLFLQDEKLYEYQDAIETVLQALETATEERDIYREEHNEITKALDFKEGSLNPPAEVCIERLKKALKNSIPKKRVEDEIEELKNMKVDGEVFTTAVNFAIKILQELLEEK